MLTLELAKILALNAALLICILLVYSLFEMKVPTTMYH